MTVAVPPQVLEFAARGPEWAMWVRRRFHTVVDAGGLDEQRALAWVVVRMVLNGLWSIQDAGVRRGP